MVPQCAYRGYRRFPLLPRRHTPLPSRGPSRPGPVPHRPMVHPRTDSGTPGTATPPTPRSETGLRTRPVPRPVLLLKDTIISPPETQRRLQRLFDAHPRLKVAWDALQELYGLYEANDLQGALQALKRFADLYDSGQIPEYHNTVDTILSWARRDPELAPQPPIQRTSRRDQQPPTDPPQNRPTASQTPKTTHPRAPINMNQHRPYSDPSHKNAQGQKPSISTTHFCRFPSRCVQTTDRV